MSWEEVVLVETTAGSTRRAIRRSVGEGDSVVVIGILRESDSAFGSK
jgi:hypothetical protein